MGGSRIVGWGKRWRGPVVTGAIASLALAGAGYIAFEADEPKRVYERQAAENAKGEADPAPVAADAACLRLPPVEKAACVHQQEQAERQTHHDEIELQAQRETAAWTRAMGMAALIAMVVGIAGIGLVFITFRETRKAAEEARKASAAMVRSNQIMEEGQRPWVIIQPQITTYNYDDTMFGMTIITRFKNIGRSVAASYHPFMRVVFAGEGYFDPINPIRKDFIRPSPSYGAILAPGDTDEVVLKNNWIIDHLPWFGDPPRVYMIILASARYRLAGYEDTEGRKDQKLTFNAFLVGDARKDVVYRRYIFRDDLRVLRSSVLGLTRTIPEEAC